MRHVSQIHCYKYVLAEPKGSCQVLAQGNCQNQMTKRLANPLRYKDPRPPAATSEPWNLYPRLVSSLGH